MPHECPTIYCLSLDFLLYFCGVSKQTVILISYAFLCFTAWLENVKSLKYQPAGHVEIC